jgi:hypothetical protein
MYFSKSLSALIPSTKKTPFTHVTRETIRITRPDRDWYVFPQIDSRSSQRYGLRMIVFLIAI